MLKITRHMNLVEVEQGLKAGFYTEHLTIDCRKRSQADDVRLYLEEVREKHRLSEYDLGMVEGMGGEVHAFRR